MSNASIALTNVIERRNKSLNSMATLASKGQNNTEIYRSLEKAANEDDETIASLRKLESLTAKDERLNGPKLVADAAATAVRQVMPGVLSAFNPAGESLEQRKAKLNAAYRSYFRTGALHTPETRDVLTSDAGAVIPQEWDADYVQALKWFAPLAAAVHRKTGSRPTKIATSDPTSLTMTYLAEGTTTSGIEADPLVFSQTNTETDALIASMIVSQEFFDDIGFDFGQFISTLATPRVGRAISYALITGKSQAGVALPNMSGGILANTTVGATTASSSAIAATDLQDVYSRVDVAYRRQGSFLMSPSVHDWLSKQEDSTGRFLYIPDPTKPFDTLFGRPILLDPAMPAFGVAGSQAIVFGAFDAFWQLIDGGISLQVLRERYADQFNVGVLTHTRIAGAPLVPSAVKSLTMAAS